ncbi:hypothetical protein BLNAU_1932 [Blattamonas nauphoetae]|uniref:Uncharacterized protein n=1 Tax=Blattamonas nauphoetae TaxID=2049346 RepID=A0ABQ9YGN2_9EUKA|nr:hypothetical protein BLNAU_1932 [Blattamonas nauphoetae]
MLSMTSNPRVISLIHISVAWTLIFLFMQPNRQSRLDTLHPVMIVAPLILYVFQRTLATSTTSSQPHNTTTNLTTDRSPIDLASVVGKGWNAIGSHTNDIGVLSIAEGTYVGCDIKITHRSVELSGEPSILQNRPGTRIDPFYESDRTWSEDLVIKQAVDCSMFFLTNSTLSLKWMDFSLVTYSGVGLDSDPEKSTRRSEKKSRRRSPGLHADLTFLS